MKIRKKIKLISVKKKLGNEIKKTFLTFSFRLKILVIVGNATINHKTK